MTHGRGQDPVSERVSESVHELAEGAREVAERVKAAAEPATERAIEVLADAVDLSLVRGAAALEALRGGPVPAPAPGRRWTWALGAALLGAAAGGVVAVLVSRLLGSDAPNAEDPEQVQAVVDRAEGIPPGDGPAGPR